ncbi:sex-determining region Y protein-like [Ochlerotatus camptorhynchus]|uniref:sex-determining region Y protein-like n=1 Tax=Ochlerotatus camptorhynchus TaxID=644619 RepID=UPI0031DF5C1B
MSSSPGDRRYAFDSPENNDGAPLYQSSDNFLPLGFSTPQHRNSGPSSQNRNYYSAQPKYMLPRQRGGFHNRNRNQYHQQHQQQQDNSGGGNSPAADCEERPAERRKFHNRDWTGQNYNQRHHNRPHHNQQHQRRNRFGFGHSQNKNTSGNYNINDYFHPSMLEDPWLQLVQQNEREKTVEGDSSDAGGGRGSGSDMGED